MATLASAVQMMLLGLNATTQLNLIRELKVYHLRICTFEVKGSNSYITEVLNLASSSWHSQILPWNWLGIRKLVEGSSHPSILQVFGKWILSLKISVKLGSGSQCISFRRWIDLTWNQLFWNCIQEEKGI